MSLSVALDSLRNCNSPSCLPRLPACWKHMVACASRSSVGPSWQTDPSCKCWMDGLGVTDEDRDCSWLRETPKGQSTCCIWAEPGVYSALILLRCEECAAAEPATQECGYPQCTSRSKTVEGEREVSEACIQRHEWADLERAVVSGEGVELRCFGATPKFAFWCFRSSPAVPS